MELNLTSRIKQALSSYKYYKNCSELPLYNFIKVLSTNNLSYLGKAPISKLEDTWEEIFSEYLGLTKDTTQNHLLSLLKEIQILRNKLFIIQAAVDQLDKEYDPALCEVLKTLGFRYKFSLDTYKNDLKLTVTKAKGSLLRLEQKENDLKLLQSDKKSEVKESDFDGLLTELSKFMGCWLDKKQLTVSEYVSILNNYKEANAKKK